MPPQHIRGERTCSICHKGWFDSGLHPIPLSLSLLAKYAISHQGADDNLLQTKCKPAGAAFSQSLTGDTRVQAGERLVRTCEGKKINLQSINVCLQLCVEKCTVYILSVRLSMYLFRFKSGFIFTLTYQPVWTVCSTLHRFTTKLQHFLNNYMLKLYIILHSFNIIIKHWPKIILILIFSHNPAALGTSVNSQVIPSLMGHQIQFTERVKYLRKVVLDQRSPTHLFMWKKQPILDLSAVMSHQFHTNKLGMCVTTQVLYNYLMRVIDYGNYLKWSFQ